MRFVNVYIIIMILWQKSKEKCRQECECSSESRMQPKTIAYRHLNEVKSVLLL